MTSLDTGTTLISLSLILLSCPSSSSPLSLPSSSSFSCPLFSPPLPPSFTFSSTYSGKRWLIVSTTCACTVETCGSPAVKEGVVIPERGRARTPASLLSMLSPPCLRCVLITTLFFLLFFFSSPPSPSLLAACVTAEPLSPLISTFTSSLCLSFSPSPLFSSSLPLLDTSSPIGRPTSPLCCTPFAPLSTTRMSMSFVISARVAISMASPFSLTSLIPASTASPPPPPPFPPCPPCPSSSLLASPSSCSPS
mmetsp:Transcript_18794/g.47649  ORF Transcript_18794/g.47649 Transcript_18794/m.47649 type:complete len:251 (+) Transcript_18794:3462-4214(+)